MPGITNPAEEYFKDGLWGWVTSAWKKLVATAGGALHIQFAGQEADVEVTQTAAADLTPGICGWDGSAWHKLPLVWGYSEEMSEDLSDSNLPAAGGYIYSTVVPGGEVHIVTAISAAVVSATCTELDIGVSVDGVEVWFVSELPPTSAKYYTVTGNFVLAEGDRVKIYLGAKTAGDNLIAGICGYKMLIAE